MTYVPDMARILAELGDQDDEAPEVAPDLKAPEFTKSDLARAKGWTKKRAEGYCEHMVRRKKWMAGRRYDRRISRYVNAYWCSGNVAGDAGDAGL